MWDEVAPIDQNGVITMYEVMYTPLEDFDGAIMTRTTNVTDYSVLLMHLEEYVNYTISVRAYTSAGAGKYSDPLIVLTNEDGECCIIKTYDYSHNFSFHQFLPVFRRMWQQLLTLPLLL